MWECCNKPHALLSISAFWMVTLCSSSATRVRLVGVKNPSAQRSVCQHLCEHPACIERWSGGEQHRGDGGRGCEMSCAIRAAQLTPARSLHWMCCVGREIAVLFVRNPQRDSKGSPQCCAGLDKRRKREARFCVLLALRKWEKTEEKSDLMHHKTSIPFSLHGSGSFSSSLSPVHLTPVPQCNLCWCSHGGAGWVMECVIGMRPQEMLNLLWLCQL